MSSASSRADAAAGAVAWRLITAADESPAAAPATLAAFALRLAALVGEAAAAAALAEASARHGLALLEPARVEQARLLARRARHRQLEALRLLAAAGIECVVLKGFALAHSLYDDPLTRIGSDIDLLLRPSALQPAIGALRAAGWDFAGPPVPRWGSIARASFAPLAAPDRATSVDLHLEADEWPFARALPATEAFAVASPLQVEELALRALPPSETLLLLVSNMAKDKFGAPALQKALDAIRLLRAGTLDARRLAALAQRGGFARPLATLGALLARLGLRSALARPGGSGALAALAGDWQRLFEPPPGPWSGLWREARFGPGLRYPVARNLRRLAGLARPRSGRPPGA